MTSIDRIDWHYGGDYPQNLPPENGGTHIGIYLAWIIDNNLIGELHLEESKEAIQKVKNRQMTGRDFLVERCDEKFWDEDLSEEGLAFTQYYYQADSNGNFTNYFDDYLQVLGKEVDSLYKVENSWDNYNKFKPVIDKKYADWKKNKR